MEKDKLLLELLKKYDEEPWYPFHMPGHKRMVGGTVLEEMGNPFGIDITEIQGFDNLHHPAGILKDSMEWAASVYGADRTWYLVNGSSGGILSAISAVMRPGGTILMARNCHKAVYHGVILNRLKIHYIYPQVIGKLGIQGGISPLDVEKSLKENRDVGAVFIVSPTYDGVVSDVRGIAQVVHGFGLPLIVDEAHGAHFSFGNMGDGRSVFPLSAVACGADLVIQSLHKTLPSLTQTAVLHLCGSRVDVGRLERYLQIYQSSSPSYVFLAGMEACIFEMEKGGKARMKAFDQCLEGLREKLLGMDHLVLLDERTIGKEKDVGKPWYALDRSRIVVSCKNCLMAVEDGGEKRWIALSGEMLMERLREEYHLELEMCGADYVVAITTVMDRPEGLERLARAFLEVDGELEKPLAGAYGVKYPAVCCSTGSMPPQAATEELTGEAVMTMGEALDSDTCKCLLEKTVGHVSAEFVYLYPPGIPILVPGELVTDQVVEKIVEYRDLKLPIQGMEDKECRVLKVVDDRCLINGCI